MKDLLLFGVSWSDQGWLRIDFSWWLVFVALPVVGWRIWLLWRRRGKPFHLVSLDIELGGVGKAEFRPNYEDIQTAHRIWTELVTRKASIPVDPDHDVIVEIYDSWYALFGRVRDLVGQIPAKLIREQKSTRELVRIATDTLNAGIRPHLTRWQARFRHWYASQDHTSVPQSPQDLQHKFPEYDELMRDLIVVNAQLAQYARELRKIVDG